MEVPLRIVYLEPDPARSELVQAALAADGMVCEFVRVETPADFLAALERGTFDLILAGCTLPSSDGISALGIARERCPEAPFIFVSGPLGEELTIEMLKRGAVDCVFERRLSRLAPVVRQALRETEEEAERRRAGEMLEEMSTALTNAMTGISRLDPEGRYMYVNDSYARLLGFEPREMIGLDWAPTVHPDDRERAITAYRRMVDEGNGEFEARAVRKGGTLFDKHVLMIKRVDKQGNFIGHHCFMRDITERKRAEDELRQTLSLLSATLESTADGILVVDANGRAVLCNRKFGEMWRIPEATLASRDLTRVLDVSSKQLEDPAGILMWLRHMRTRPQAIDPQAMLRLKDGRIFERSSQPQRIDGRTVGRVVSFRDVTASKREEATRQALYHASLEIQAALGLRERLDRLLHTARWVLELDRLNILLADPEERWLQAVAALGVEGALETIRVPIGPEGGGLAEAYRSKLMVMWDGRTPLPPRLRLRPPYDQIEALRSRVFVNLPLVVQGRVIGVMGVDRKRTRRPIDATTVEILQLFAAQAALAIEHGRLYEAQRMAAIQLEATVEARTRDLQAANTQLQEANHRLEAASRHKSAFLANVSHELRTPLNSILGFSDLLLRQTFGTLTEKQSRGVEQIRAGGQHLYALINDLLDLSKVEAGKLELHPSPFHPGEAIEAALHTILPQAEARLQQLELHVAEELPTLTADPVRLRQILYNLFSNAVKFTPAGGRITVTVERWSRGESLGAPEVSSPVPNVHHRCPGEFIEIAVRDTGIGLKRDDLPKLFQPFTQLETPLARRDHGTGLGLALTKQLVELHGGAIWAASDGEGKGSTFTVRLPVAGVWNPPQLLIADDDEALVSTLRDALAASGYAVEVVGDGAAALARIAAARPDLMILDLILPEVDGLGVLRQLRIDPTTRSLPVIAITGMEVDQTTEVLAAGADDFLTKPFSLPVLESTVRRLLQRNPSTWRMPRRTDDAESA